MEKKQKIITKVCNYENDTQGLKNIHNSQDTTMYFTESVVSQFIKARDEDHLRFLCNQIKEWLKENKVSVGFVINEDELRDCLEDHRILKEQIKKLEQENLLLQEDSIRENQINVTETVELDKEINKLKEENIELKKQHKKINELEDSLRETNECLSQIYSHLGVEAFGKDIQRQAVKEIDRLMDLERK